MELAGQHVLVVGLGRSGIAAAQLLLARGAQVTVNDLRGLAQLGAEVSALADAGARLALGTHDEALFVGADRIVVSPGVPHLPQLSEAEARGIPIIGEIELAASFVQSTLIGVTGTNGKSTVTSLVGEMCAQGGRPTFVGGNLGTPLIDVVDTPAAAPGGYVVVELSSFQLERVDRLHVNAAALLNVTEDHLDRYPSFEAYAEAKAAIFHNQQPSDSAVVPDGNVLCAELATRGQGTLRPFGGDHGEVRLQDGQLLDTQSGLRVPVDAIGLRGQHNLDNACAAALLARAAGVPAEHIDRTLRSFAGLPHRMQRVRERAGVVYFDDSKATNVGAAVAALDGLRELLRERGGKVVLIAGGKDKGGSYTTLERRLFELGRAVVLIGEAADRIERALPDGPPCVRAQSMPDAVTQASELARPGDVVLLAPACASFDMFRSYAHRGEVFAEAVRALPEGGS